MDATQLSLFLNARAQAASRLTLQLGSDPVGSDNAFANMLQQRQADQAEQQRQLDQERQTRRNQSSSTSPVPTAQPTSGATAATATTDSSRSQTTDKTQPYASRSQDNSSKAAAATGSSTSPQQGTAATDKAAAKSTGKTGKADDATTKDTDQSSDDQAASASGSLTNHGKQDPQHPGKLADGNDPTGNGGQNQGQNSQDGKSQQGANDGDTATATVEGIESTILASLVTGQVPTSGGTAPSGTGTGTGTGTTIGAILPGGGKTPVAGADGQAAATAAAGTTGAAATGAAGLAAALSIPGPGAGSATAAASQAAGNSVSNQQVMGLDPLSQQSRTTPSTDPDTTFANIISKKVTPASTDSDNLHVSVSKTGSDSSAQMPRPLVRIDDSKTPQASVQPASTLTQTEALTAASSDASSDQDLGLDDVRGLGTYSPLMPGSSFALAGKPVDAMTALRQQLANASIQDQVAIHMQRAVNNSVDKISIQLSPAELGRIHVKMTVDDDKQVSATITVERPATLDLLQRDAKTLERALQDAGLKTDSGSLSFSLQRGNQGDSSDTPGWGQSGGRQIGSSGQEKTAAVTDISSTTAGNAVDTANGLVDVAV
jgi:hypothetical protein